MSLNSTESIQAPIGPQLDEISGSRLTNSDNADLLPESLNLTSRNESDNKSRMSGKSNNGLGMSLASSTSPSCVNINSDHIPYPNQYPNQYHGTGCQYPSPYPIPKKNPLIIAELQKVKIMLQECITQLEKTRKNRELQMNEIIALLYKSITRLETRDKGTMTAIMLNESITRIKTHKQEIEVQLKDEIIPLLYESITRLETRNKDEIIALLNESITRLGTRKDKIIAMLNESITRIVTHKKEIEGRLKDKRIAMMDESTTRIVIRKKEIEELGNIVAEHEERITLLERTSKKEIEELGNIVAEHEERITLLERTSKKEIEKLQNVKIMLYDCITPLERSRNEEGLSRNFKKKVKELIKGNERHNKIISQISEKFTRMELEKMKDFGPNFAQGAHITSLEQLVQHYLQMVQLGNISELRSVEELCSIIRDKLKPSDDSNNSEYVDIQKEILIHYLEKMKGYKHKNHDKLEEILKNFPWVGEDEKLSLANVRECIPFVHGDLSPTLSFLAETVDWDDLNSFISPRPKTGKAEGHGLVFLMHYLYAIYCKETSATAQKLESLISFPPSGEIEIDAQGRIETALEGTIKIQIGEMKMSNKKIPEAKKQLERFLVIFAGLHKLLTDKSPIGERIFYHLVGYVFILFGKKEGETVVLPLPPIGNISFVIFMP